VVWGCIGFISFCVHSEPRANVVPLKFGMTRGAAAAALQVHLVPAPGRRGAGGVYLAERQEIVASHTPFDKEMWLQFRNGRLTGWKTDWNGPWPGIIPP
jgi:hypothetical protein